MFPYTFGSALSPVYPKIPKGVYIINELKPFKDQRNVHISTLWTKVYFQIYIICCSASPGQIFNIFYFNVHHKEPNPFKAHLWLLVVLVLPQQHINLHNNIFHVISPWLCCHVNHCTQWWMHYECTTITKTK